jgi:hypothetical protein
MSATEIAKPVQFTMSDLVKLVQADPSRGSVRRAIAMLATLGIAPEIPQPELLTNAQIFAGQSYPVHFFEPRDNALSACTLPGKVTRTGRKVTCEFCKDKHRADKLATAKQPAADAGDYTTEV